MIQCVLPLKSISRGRLERAVARIIRCLFGFRPDVPFPVQSNVDVNHVGVATHRAVFNVLLAGAGRQINRDYDLLAARIANIARILKHRISRCNPRVQSAIATNLIISAMQLPWDRCRNRAQSHEHLWSGAAIWQGSTYWLRFLAGTPIRWIPCGPLDRRMADRGPQSASPRKLKRSRPRHADTA